MRHELYVTAAALAATMATVGKLLALPAATIWSVAIPSGFALRGAAIHWSLSLPTYGRNRPKDG